MSTVMTIGKRVDPNMKFTETPATRTTSFTIYAQMTNIDDLQHATYLDNREFYYVDLDNRYRDIIEMIVIDISGVKFELVTRKLKPDKINFIDTTATINVETFLALKNAASLGFKHKYLQFPIPETPDFWEVSVFLDNGGQDHMWVRLELYTDDVSLVQNLPFDVAKFIVEGDPNNRPEDAQFIDRLWVKEYSRIDTDDVLKR